MDNASLCALALQQSLPQTRNKLAQAAYLPQSSHKVSYIGGLKAAAHDGELAIFALQRYQRRVPAAAEQCRCNATPCQECRLIPHSQPSLELEGNPCCATSSALLQLCMEQRWQCYDTYLSMHDHLTSLTTPLTASHNAHAIEQVAAYFAGHPAAPLSSMLHSTYEAHSARPDKDSPKAAHAQGSFQGRVLTPLSPKP